MSRTIDEKVVEMKFDNKQFVSGVSSTISSLDKLKQNLNMDTATKSFEKINTVAKKIDLSPISNAAETVKSKFSALEVVAVTALANITNSVVNTGKQILNSLTLEPVMSGFQEYETQINAIQTIQANTSGKGTTLDQINDALDELNHYADMTIYNFTEMTRNIGTFTAAGVDLDTSVSAIKGIANLAAVSGSTSQQASTAMYQLSQALAAGTVKLMDWNSVVNAGMGGQVFQDALKETARVHGIAIDSMIEKEGSFRETLSDGWLTSEILTETLSKFTGDLNEDQLRTMGYTDEQIASIIEMGQTANDAATKVKTFTQLFDTLKEAAQSGWTSSWEIIVGDFEEARTLLTKVSDVVSGILNDQAAARNNLLQGWKDLGGRTELINALTNVFAALWEVIKHVSYTFRKIFPATTSQQLYDITEKFKQFTDKLMPAVEAKAMSLKRIFRGLFSIVDIGKQAFTTLIKAIAPLLSNVSNVGGGILDFAGNIGNAIYKFDLYLKKIKFFDTANERIATIMSKVSSTIKAATTYIDSFKDKITEKLDLSQYETLTIIFNRVKTRLSQLEPIFIKIKSVIVNSLVSIKSAFISIGHFIVNCEFVNIIPTIWQGLAKLGSGAIATIGKLGSAIKNAFSSINFNGVSDAINGISLATIGAAIAKFIKGISDSEDSATKVLTNFGDAIKDVGKIKDSVVDLLDGVRGCFETYQKKIKSDILLKIATAVAILAGSLIALSIIDSEKLTGATLAISALFGDLVVATGGLDKLNIDSKNLSKNTKSLIAMAAAVLIMASAVKKLASLNGDELTNGLIGVGALCSMLTACMKILSSGETKTSSAKMLSIGVSMIAMAAAMKILASAVKDFGSMDWDALSRGMAGLGGGMLILAAGANLMPKKGKLISMGAGLIEVAAAMKILASAVKDFGSMDWDTLSRGMAGLCGGILILAGAMNVMPKNMVGTGTGLVIVAAAMKILASVVKDFGNIDWDDMQNGLLGMGIALGEVAVAINIMPKNMVGIGAGLAVVSAALLILVEVVARMGSMDWDTLSKGLVSLGGAMLILAVGLNAMTGTLAGAAALLVATVALNAFVPVMLALGKMSWKSIAKGLITIASAFAILGIAGLVLSPIIAPILGVTAALALIGVAAIGVGAGLVLIGAGLTSIAAGLAALAASGATWVVSIMSSLGVMISGIIGFIPTIINGVSQIIVAMCQAIIASIPSIAEVVKTIVLTSIDVLTSCAPTIAEGVFSTLSTVLAALVEYLPSIIASLYDILILILNGLAAKMPELIAAIVGVVKSLFEGVINVIKEIDTEKMVQLLEGVGLMSAIMIALGATSSLVPSALAGIAGLGVAVAELGAIITAFGALAQIPGLSWLVGEGGDLLQGIGTAIGQFVGGILGGIVSGFTDGLPQIGADLSSFMINATPFIVGASSIDNKMMDGVKALAETILILTKAEIIDGLTSWITGGGSIASFAADLIPLGAALMAFSNEISGLDGETVNAAANAGKTLAEMADTIPNSGGVVSFFTGENDMLTFSGQLVLFGTAMKSFGESVAGMDSDAVINAANAGKALAEMADTVPNSGGVVSFFTGENDLGTFGTNLVSFGEGMKSYGDAVAGLDVDSVKNSTTAGSALVELADTVPNTGGLFDFFTGKDDLGTFGTQLVSFGEGMKSYAESVKDLDVDVVTNSTNAAQSLVALADNLPESTNFLKKFFNGDNDLSTFGDDLVSFGCSFATYYAYVGGIDTEQLAGVLQEFKSLIELAEGITDIDTSGMSTFATDLTLLGDSGVTGFISAFTNANEKLKTAVNAMLDSVKIAIILKAVDLTLTAGTLIKSIVNIFTSNYSKFTAIGQTVMDKLLNGIKSKESAIRSFFNSLLTVCLTLIKNRYSEFNSAGQTLVAQFASGISERASSAKNAVSSMIGDCIWAIRDRYNEFYDAGTYFVEGFHNGIKDHVNNAKDQATEMARAAANAVKKELDINSPSKVGYELGGFFGMGFTNSLDDYADTAYNSGEAMAKSARDGLRNTIAAIGDCVNDSIDSQPTIRPVLDLSQVRSGAGKLSALLGGSKAASINASVNSRLAANNQNEAVGSSKSTNINFTQNNYSPKALSRIDIYRQTKNQFSALGGIITT